MFDFPAYKGPKQTVKAPGEAHGPYVFVPTPAQRLLAARYYDLISARMTIQGGARATSPMLISAGAGYQTDLPITE